MIRKLATFSLAAAALGLTTAAQGIMIDINGANGPTATGWEAFNQADDNGAVNVGPVTYLDAFGVGQDFSLQIVITDTNPDGSDVRWKNDSVISGTPTEMWQDWGGPRRMDTMDLILTMPEGAYDFTVYGSTQAGSAEITPPGGSAQTFTADAVAGTFSDSFTVGAGETGATISIENQGDGPFRLHGLEVTLVPEPASLALLGLGGLCLLPRRKR